MHTSAWVNALWALEVFGEGLIAFEVVRRQRMSRWGGLAVYCAMSACMNAVLWQVHSNYAHYFWWYWAWRPAAALLRLGVLSDAIRSIPGSSMIGIRISTVIGTAALFMAVGAWQISMLAGTAFSDRLVRTAVLLDRSVCVAWSAFLVAALVGVSLLRLGWALDGAFVAVGLAVRVGGAMMVSFFMSYAPLRQRSFGTALDCAVTFMGLWLWFRGIKTFDDLPSAQEVLAPKLLRQ